MEAAGKKVVTSASIEQQSEALLARLNLEVVNTALAADGNQGLLTLLEPDRVYFEKRPR